MINTLIGFSVMFVVMVDRHCSSCLAFHVSLFISSLVLRGGERKERHLIFPVTAQTISLNAMILM